MHLFRRKSHHSDNRKPRAIANSAEDTSSCFGCFSFFRRAKDYFSKDYTYVCFFLYDLRDQMKPCHIEVNKTVLASAIKAAREFAEINQTTVTTYDEMLNETINDLKCVFLLTDDIEIDYLQLKQYCIDNEIKIPKVIREVLNNVEAIEFTG